MKLFVNLTTLILAIVISNTTMAGFNQMLSLTKLSEDQFLAICEDGSTQRINYTDNPIHNIVCPQNPPSVGNYKKKQQVIRTSVITYKCTSMQKIEPSEIRKGKGCENITVTDHTVRNTVVKELLFIVENRSVIWKYSNESEGKIDNFGNFIIEANSNDFGEIIKSTYYVKGRVKPNSDIVIEDIYHNSTHDYGMDHRMSGNDYHYEGFTIDLP